jgi:NIMA (never in mitosis gene a)-related kinase
MHTTSVRDFKKEKILGKGSFGSVYLVRRRQDNKIYALKTVILNKLNKKEQENSVNEVRILASVNHPNVIGYKEAFWDDEKSSLNIVMEYADDGDLHSKIERMKKEGGYFKESLIWSYAIQMIEGLKALHDMKIMHRDLKSANIFLVKENYQCKLGDMNVSKVVTEKFLNTQTGTPYYASPEVWNDNPYSYKSDLWSIGCVVYELCALRPPFQGKDLDELYENVCRGQPERINQMYSDDLWNMILMLLQVDVNKRVDCKQFLESDLIKRKIQEMSNEPNAFIESLNYDKNKESDDYLLKTIKFNDIKEIKAQLPTKKNYNNNFLSDNLKYNKNNKNIANNKYTINSKNNEDEILSKKIKEKQIELEKMKNYLNKEEKSKNKIRKKKIISKKDNNENELKQAKSIIYQKNSLSNSTVNEEKDSLIKDHPNKDLSNFNSGRKTNHIEISKKGKKLDIYELYLKKNTKKINNAKTNSYSKNDKCKSPVASYKLNNKLIPSSSLEQPSEKDNPFKRITKNCRTCVDRKKEIKYIEGEEDKDVVEDIQPSNTVEVECNYVYNKPNLMIKKQNSINSKNNIAQQRPQSATPIYKRTPKLNPSLYKSNLPVSNSFKKDKNYKETQQPNTPHYNKKDIKEINNYQHKLNRYYSYGLSITTPTHEAKAKSNLKEKEVTLQKNSSALISPKNISNCSKYMKKLNVKSYQQKLNSLQNDNFYEKQAMYGKIFEREKNEEKNKEKKKDLDKDKDKEKITKKKQLNIDLRNSNNKKNGSIIPNNSNAFLNHIKSMNSQEGVNPVLNCYLSPRNNNSQIYNNFYSINLPVPVKVINIFKQ